MEDTMNVTLDDTLDDTMDDIIDDSPVDETREELFKQCKLRSAYFNIIKGYYELKDYDAIREFIKKYNVPVDINNWNNDDNLVWLACEKLDYQCIDFCIENGCDLNTLSRGTCKAMGNYKEESKKETCEFIDYLIQRGAGKWDVMHYSLVGSDCIELHKHIKSKWSQDKNFDIQNTLRMCGRFGNFESIKYILEDEDYSKCLSTKDIEACLIELVRVDTGCDSKRYKSIEYLAKDKKIRLDDTMMQKINYFLAKYSPDALDKAAWEIYPWTDEEENDANFQMEMEKKRDIWTNENILYMPDLFKTSKEWLNEYQTNQYNSSNQCT